MGPRVPFDHLIAMTTPVGLWEHAILAEPRREHGFCVDDVARGLVVTAREPSPADGVRRLARIYLRFVIRAQNSQGLFHNRRGVNGTWDDVASSHDHWGRAVWALGTAAASSVDDEVRQLALGGAAIGMRARSRWPRAMAYAALGAFEVLRVRPGDRAARRLMGAARDVIGRAGTDPAWPWPEARLTYANAVLPEAMLVIGSALNDDLVRRDGLTLLRWLVDLQTSGGHLSLFPAGGWQRGDARPGFDQQPIEVTALAEACGRAFALTADTEWLTAIERCVAWFDGDNDLGLTMYDRVSGGGYDGLHADRVNENQGAESTLAVQATFQIGRLAAVSVS